jgi:NADPH:quinone reductase-like Zn-dependent oxidoreductase
VKRAFNYRDTDYVAAAREELRGRGFDLILDPLGPESFRKGLDLLDPLGRIVCYGFSSLVTGPKRRLWHAVLSLLKASKVSPISLMNANKGVFGLNLAHLLDQKDKIREAMVGLRERLESGSISPTLDSTFPLSAEGARRAHEHLHARKNFGKVVLVRA